MIRPEQCRARRKTLPQSRFEHSLARRFRLRCRLQWTYIYPHPKSYGIFISSGCLTRPDVNKAAQNSFQKACRIMLCNLRKLLPHHQPELPVSKPLGLGTRYLRRHREHSEPQGLDLWLRSSSMRACRLPLCASQAYVRAARIAP